MKRHAGRSSSAVCILASCIGAFALTALVLNLAVEWRPYMGGYSDKLEVLSRNPDEYSVLFIGSSRTHSDIDPHVFDLTLRKEGFRVRSFNLGVDSLMLFELKTLVDVIAGTQPSSLRYIFLEPTFHTHIPLRNLHTTRTIYFHDLENTRLAIACNVALPRYRATVGRNFLACVYHYANLGRLASIVFPSADAHMRPSILGALERSSGFYPMDADRTPERLEWHGNFLSNIGNYIESQKAENPSAGSHGAMYATHNETILQIARSLKAAGIDPVLLITPTYHNVHIQEQFESFHQNHGGDQLTLLSYLSGFDELYDPYLYWWDIDHLNEAGAKMFSKRLGQDFAAMIRARSGGRRFSADSIEPLTDVRPAGLLPSLEGWYSVGPGTPSQ